MSTEFPIELAEKELSGDATPNDIAVLNSNPELWRSYLASIKRRVDMDIMNKRAESIASGFGKPKVLAEFHEWRGRAVYFKSLVEDRLSHLKRTIKENNLKATTPKEKPGSGEEPAPSKLDEIIYLLEDILEELKAGRST